MQILILFFFFFQGKYSANWEHCPGKKWNKTKGIQSNFANGRFMVASYFKQIDSCELGIRQNIAAFFFFLFSNLNIQFFFFFKHFNLLIWSETEYFVLFLFRISQIHETWTKYTKYFVLVFLLEKQLFLRGRCVSGLQF